MRNIFYKKRNEKKEMNSTQDSEQYLLYLEDITKKYNDKIVLEDIDLAVRAGEFCTVVGPSGCGKSTLLRLILGQESPTSGKILMENKDIILPSPERGIVYQKYALFPHLSILKNVMLGKTLPLAYFDQLKQNKAIQQEAMDHLESVQLAEHADKYPHELSGGMQQRVAIAQALIMKPKILMMDEPFGALDPGTREAMQLLILKLWEEHKMTIFFVTHDLEEAVFLGTRIIVISQFYTHELASKQSAPVGSRIVSDYSLSKGDPSSTKIKETAEFGQLIQKIRYEGFDPEYRQNAADFNLTHSDSFQTHAAE